jgi:transcriptional regulator NrdR family protein
MLVEKKDGLCEKFDEKKAYKKFCNSCLNAHLSKKESSAIANKSIKDLKKSIKNRKKINSNALFKKNIKILKKYSKEAAFLYETHRDIN